MTRDTFDYREVAVESVEEYGRVVVRAVNGQAFSPEMRVECSRQLRDTAVYPLGTCFLVLAKMTDRLGGEPYLYVFHGDPVKLLAPAQLETFLNDRRRLRI
ncbi:hypothetical protein [Duganella sp. Root198D2]|uniref:hypothetical protein n=1 Tax=Duganella sp. Root198D2 TaxID=1736489 RepID=UPI00070CF357|nr:hypothetical protein [Duganella sp. Root198D2]KRB81614.1 hypothetical protein ASE26_14810 [Duganella sp. Root198D2]